MKNEIQFNQANLEAEDVIRILNPYCKRIIKAGSIRRKASICGDIDIVCIVKNQPMFTHFVDKWEKVRGKPDGKITHRILPSGNMLDLTMCSEKTWGLKLIRQTGPKEFWLLVKDILVQEDKYEEDYFSEREVFEACGLDYIEPEKRR